MNPLLLKNIREYLIQFLSWEDLFNIRSVDTAFHALLNDHYYQPLIDQRFCTYMNKKVDEIGQKISPRPRYCQYLNYYEVCLINAILSDKPSIVNYLMKWRRTDILNLVTVHFYYAIYTDNIRILKILLSHSDISGGYKFFWMLTDAVCLDRINILEYLLHIDEDKSLCNAVMNIDWHTLAGKEHLILNTCENGNASALKILLNDGRFLPCRYLDINYFLIAAAQRGNYEIVEILMNIPDLDPTFRDNMSLRRALRLGHDMTVEILLRDDRVHAFYQRN